MDDELTRPAGSVAFNRVSPGRYYIVVTFPTMLEGQKAAWQVPVEAVSDRMVHVELNAANMALRPSQKLSGKRSYTSSSTSG